MTDRRALFATERVADIALRGRLDRRAFARPEARSVTSSDAFLHASPGGARDRQLLHGDAVDLLEARGRWGFVRSGRDGYVGWVEMERLGPPVAATHRVAVRATHLYPHADMKEPPIARLPMNSRLAVLRIDALWAVTPDGAVPASHLRPLDAPEADPVAVAEALMGAPYLWAGNTDLGIDCSGLVQVACHACAIPCPGDSDQQEITLGRPLEPGAPVRRGDLIFWRGHVAWVADPAHIVHANAWRMSVSREPIDAAIARIEAAGEGPVTSRRRL